MSHSSRARCLFAVILLFACGDSHPLTDAGFALDAPPPGTVAETVVRLRVLQPALADRFCSCPEFVDALAAWFERDVDEASCRMVFMRPESSLECLVDNFGPQSPEVVPGLTCEVDVLLQAVACVDALGCGGDVNLAVQCIDTADDGVDDCNLGSVSSGDPPELIACF